MSNCSTLTFELIKRISKLKRALDIKVLLHLYSLSNCDTGEVELTKDVRDSVLNQLGCSTQALSGSLNRLKSLSLLLGNNKNYCLVYPSLFEGCIKKIDNE